MRDLTAFSEFYSYTFVESDLLTRLILREYFNGPVFEQLALLSMRDQRSPHPVKFVTSTAYVLHQWLSSQVLTARQKSVYNSLRRVLIEKRLISPKA
jgi:hypothetical protein